MADAEDPLKHFQNKKCRSCGAGLRVMANPAGGWTVYHVDPWCAWFGQQHAERMKEREREQQNRATIDAALARKR